MAPPSLSQLTHFRSFVHLTRRTDQTERWHQVSPATYIFMTFGERNTKNDLICCRWVVASEAQQPVVAGHLILLPARALGLLGCRLHYGSLSISGTPAEGRDWNNLRASPEPRPSSPRGCLLSDEPFIAWVLGKQRGGGKGEVTNLLLDLGRGENSYCFSDCRPFATLLPEW